MKTISISKKDMESRISRFSALKPLPIQDASMPEKARDVVYARKLLSMMRAGFGGHAVAKTG